MYAIRTCVCVHMYINYSEVVIIIDYPLCAIVFFSSYVENRNKNPSASVCLPFRILIVSTICSRIFMWIDCNFVSLIISFSFRFAFIGTIQIQGSFWDNHPSFTLFLLHRFSFTSFKWWKCIKCRIFKSVFHRERWRSSIVIIWLLEMFGTFSPFNVVHLQRDER